MTGDALLAKAYERLPFWQERLRLRDYQIKLQVARQHQLGEGTLGDVDLGSGSKRQGLIRLLHPDDLGGQGFHFDGEVWDWELTLVHELIHVHFHDCLPPDWTHDRLLNRAVERAIDALAKALITSVRTGGGV